MLSSDQKKQGILFILFVLYFLVPGRKGTILDGIPLNSASELYPFLFLVFIFFVLRWKDITDGLFKKIGISILVLTCLKILIGVVSIDYGLVGRYYADTIVTKGEFYEKSTEFRFKKIDGTRIDRVISFEDWEFPLYFFNDHRRFNFIDINKRVSIPFSIQWDGYIYIPEEKSFNFYLSSDDGSQLYIDNRLVIDNDGFHKTKELSASVKLDSGLHKIHVNYFQGRDFKKEIHLSQDINDQKEVVPYRFLLASPVSPFRYHIDPYLIIPSYMLHIVAIVLLFLLVKRNVEIIGYLKEAFGNRYDRLFVLCVFLLLGYTLIFSSFASPTYLVLFSSMFLVLFYKMDKNEIILTFLENVLLFSIFGIFFIHGISCTTKNIGNNTIILSGGDDWLTYESLSRFILLDDFLQNIDKAPFYFQPLYPYLLAIAHLIFGENLWGIIVVQHLILGAVLVNIYFIAKSIFGRRSALSTIIILYPFFEWSSFHFISHFLLGELPFTLLVSISIFLIIRMINEQKPQFAILSGLMLGLATLTRSSFLLFLPFVLLYCYFQKWNSPKLKQKMIAIMIISTLLVISTATVRNYIVSKRFVLITTSGPINLYLGNQPPKSANIVVNNNREKVYDLLNLDLYVRKVIEYAIQQPKLFLTGLKKKLFYAIGLDPKIDSLLYTTAIYLFFTIFFPRKILRTSLVHLFVFSHFLAVVLFFPWVYGYRLILSAYPFMVIFVADSIVVLLGRLQRFTVKGL